MRTTDNILSFRIDIPKSELSIFEFLAKKMGWKIHDKSVEVESGHEKRQESELFFENSKRSMAQHIQKYLSE